MFVPTYFVPTYFPGSYFPPGAGTVTVTPPSAASKVPFTGLHTIKSCEKFQALGKNSTELIQSLREEYVGTPSARLGGESETILRAFDKVLVTYVYPRVQSVDEGYYLVKDRVTRDPASGYYRVPKQAHDGQLAKVEHDGRELTAGTGAFQFVGDSVEIEGATGTVVLSYYVHPPRLAVEDKARQIQSIDYETGDVTISTSVAGWDGEICFNVQSGSRTHDMIEWDAVGTVTGTTIRFDSAVLKGTSEYRAGVRPGDYLVDTGYSFFPLVPPSLHHSLVEGVAAEYAKRNADSDWGVWKGEFQNSLSEGLRNVDRRNDGVNKVINKNSTIRTKGRRRLR